MSKAKTSKPESSAIQPQQLPSFDKLYWSRIGLAALAGFLAEVIVGTDYLSGISIGILFYLVSYYLARFAWYRGLGRAAQGKIYSAGVGSFILTFLFSWILFFTLQTAGYSL